MSVRVPVHGPRETADALDGALALVTGAGRRLGRVIALALADAGADVVIHHRASAEDARAVVDEVEARGRRAWTVRHDFADAASDPGRVIAGAADVAGRDVDVLVNSASAFPSGRLDALTLEDVTAAFRVNAWAPFALTRALAATAREGAVVNVLDARLDAPDRSRAAYALSKSALDWFTRATALEYAPRVRVNAVAPGPVLPPADGTDADLARAAAGTPLARPATPEDVAAAVVMLARARSITGTTVHVDAGQHLLGEPVHG